MAGEITYNQTYSGILVFLAISNKWQCSTNIQSYWDWLPSELKEYVLTLAEA